MSDVPLMPAAFIGHGSPMNTLEVNGFTSRWRAFGASLPRPRAVLVVSAHWFIHGSAVTAMPQPRVIHDFFGFPRELFEFNYPAPGAPDVAREVVEAVQPMFVGLDEDSWGLDHGTWSVLAHVFPEADVPVLQLSINAGEDFDYHFALGARLASLRERGVLILGSGNVVHNLRQLDWSRPTSVDEWGQRFDDDVRHIMATDPARIVDVARHADYAASVPTPEHFLPLVYIAGLAAASGEPAEVFIEGGSMGALTMTSYAVGMHVVRGQAAVSSTAAIPHPRDIPPEQTNI